MKNFEKKLNEFLKTSGISQSKLARETGLSQSQVSNISNAKFVRYTENACKLNDYISKHSEKKPYEVPEKIQREIKNILIERPFLEEQLCQFISNINSLINKERNEQKN